MPSKKSKQRNSQVKDSFEFRPDTELFFGIQPRNDEQKKVFDAFNNRKNVCHIVYGPAGTGKTFLALIGSLWLFYHNQNKYKEGIYLFKSIAPIEDIGSLPGDEKDKIRLYVESYYMKLNRMKKAGGVLSGLINYLEKNDLLKIQSMAGIMGCEFEKSIVIVDEVQTLNPPKTKLLVQRMGDPAILFLLGDVEQNIAINKSEKNGLFHAIKGLGDQDRVSSCKLQECQRSYLNDLANKRL